MSRHSGKIQNRRYSKHAIAGGNGTGTGSGSDYKEMLKALMDARTVCLSLMAQLGIHNFKEEELRTIVRKCALDLVARKPVLAAALKPTKSKPKRTKRMIPSSADSSGQELQA